MGKILLLTGKPRVGKTSALKKIIHTIGIEYCGGFYTEEIRDHRNRVGFKCVTLDEKELKIADVNLQSQIRIGRYGLEINKFEKVAIDAIDDSLRNKKITVIDEIGPMQMLSAKFQMALDQILQSSQIVLGTIFHDGHPLIDEIKAKYDAEIYTITCDNRDHIADEVSYEILKIM
jgi:nucleoside-triphosphatase